MEIGRAISNGFDLGDGGSVTVRPSCLSAFSSLLDMVEGKKPWNTLYWGGGRNLPRCREGSHPIPIPAISMYILHSAPVIWTQVRGTIPPFYFHPVVRFTRFSVDRR